MKATIAKLIMALHKQDINVSDEDALAYFTYSKFDIKMLDDKGNEVVLISKEDIKEIMDALDNKSTGLQIGDVVEVQYNHETVEGKIKSVAYQVEGAGVKHFKEAEITKK
jgi:hypothetical protein